MVTNESNPLLHEITKHVAEILKTDNEQKTSPAQFTHSIELDDALRVKLLKVLVSYSAKIPHPSSGLLDSEDMAPHSQQQSLTLLRWQILSFVSGIDLTVAKWFESHLDALSILNEINHTQTPKGIFAVWAAEGHPDPIRYSNELISGCKSWCSGANFVDYGLMTYRDDDGQSQLLLVDMTQNIKQSNIAIDNSGWQAVGMQATDTATLSFDGACATKVGEPNAYLERVGFWHGAAGVAACWYGAASRLAGYLLESYDRKPNDFKAMYMGEMSAKLTVTQRFIYYVAHLIDTTPQQSHELVIRQLRLQVEQITLQVLEMVGQALGAAPFCTNAHFATLSADLTVFIRQSHGAFDHKHIGTLVNETTEQGVNPWLL